MRVTIYDKVIRELWNGGCEVYLRLMFKFVSHGDAFDTLHFTAPS